MWRVWTEGTKGVIFFKELLWLLYSEQAEREEEASLKAVE